MCSSLYHSPAEKATQDPSHLCCQIQAYLPSVQILQTNQPPVCSPLHGFSAFAKPSCLPSLTFVNTLYVCEYSLSCSIAECYTLAIIQPILFASSKMSQHHTTLEPMLFSMTISWIAGHMRTDVSYIHKKLSNSYHCILLRAWDSYVLETWGPST